MAEVNPYQPPKCAFPGCHHQIDVHALPTRPPYTPRKACSVGVDAKGRKCACTQFIAAAEHTHG